MITDEGQVVGNIIPRLFKTLNETDFHLDGFRRRSGKVRDIYIGHSTKLEGIIILVTTDRISAFDRNLVSIPYKGQVLTLTSLLWFEKLRYIIPNHVIDSPDPNVLICEKCVVYPIEFVVRGYITGTTSTSLWNVYKNGSRTYCGHSLPEGLVVNQKLLENIVTPTTKESTHDRPISPQEIVRENLMTKEDYEYCEKKALEIFELGQRVAEKHGLILVDTKYEFGKDRNGIIRIVDEVHTPDSSRYWISESYEKRFLEGMPPESVDKDIIRRWFNENCDPYNDPVLPKAPEDLIVRLSTRYIELYERITGRAFDFGPSGDIDLHKRIEQNLKGWLDKKMNEDQRPIGHEN